MKETMSETIKNVLFATSIIVAASLLMWGAFAVPSPKTVQTNTTSDTLKLGKTYFFKTAGVEGVLLYEEHGGLFLFRIWKGGHENHVNLFEEVHVRENELREVVEK